MTQPWKPGMQSRSGKSPFGDNRPWAYSKGLVGAIKSGKPPTKEQLERNAAQKKLLDGKPLSTKGKPDGKKHGTGLVHGPNEAKFIEKLRKKK